MTQAIATEGRLLAHDVYTLIQTLDPAVFKADFEARVRELAQQIRQRIAALQEACARPESGEVAAFREALIALARQLEALQERARARLEDVPDWRGLFKALQPRYDALVTRLGAFAPGLDLPTLRPTNVKRSLFHMMNGLVALTALQLFPLWLVRAVPGALAVFAWTCEIARRVSPAVNERLMRAFAPIAHAHEHHRINSATWYTTALLFIAFVFPVYACSAAVLVLGFADPAAAAIGRRWGRTRLMAGRSLEGTLTFAVVGLVAALGALLVFHPELGTTRAVTAAAAAGAAGAVAELFSGRRVDDNLTIPIASAWAAWAVL